MESCECGCLTLVTLAFLMTPVLCSHTIECVLILWSVFSYYRMCSHTIECVPW